MADNDKNQVKEDKKNKKKSIIKEWVIDLSVVGIIALFIWNFLGYGVWITSGSMIPTLQVKDRLIVSRVHNLSSLKEGEIVLFKQKEYPDEVLIKRLIGLPGDKIEIKNGHVFRNDEELKEDYVKNTDQSDGIYKIPSGKYFFLGDNRPNSADSRYWNDPYVDGADIQGKAILRYWPIKDFKVFD